MKANAKKTRETNKDARRRDTRLRHRQVFVMKKAQGEPVPYHRIAWALGVSAEEVKALEAAALEKLQHNPQARTVFTNIASGDGGIESYWHRASRTVLDEW